MLLKTIEGFDLALLMPPYKNIDLNAANTYMNP
jgi:hypothetical protein